MGKQYTKREDGRYHTTVSTGKYDPDTGKSIVIDVYGRTMRELEDNKADVRSALKKGTYASDKGYTVSVYAKLWKETYKPNDDNYKNILRNHFSSINDIRLRDLTKTDIQNCINKKSGHYDIQRRIRMTINQILECAIEDGLIYKNVCRKIELPPKPKTNKRALFDFEIKAIKKALAVESGK